MPQSKYFKDRYGRIYGFGYDFRLYCVGANEIASEYISTEKLLCETYPYRGSDSFAFPITEGDGVFCDFNSHEESLGGVIFIEESDRDDSSHFDMPWKKGKYRDVHRVTIDEDYREDLAAAVIKITAASPLKKAYLKVRCQCKNENNIIGMLTSEEVAGLIRNDEILGNVIYVIYDSDEDESEVTE